MTTPRLVQCRNSSEEDCKMFTDNKESDSSMEDTSELAKEESVPFMGFFAFFNSTIHKWKVCTIHKDVPNDKLVLLDQGSFAQYMEMGLFDDMETEMHPGSRRETMLDLMQMVQGSIGYQGDDETSKSSSAKRRRSALSVSTFEGGHLGASRNFFRPSLELSLDASGSEFVVPKHPAVRQAMRSSSLEPVHSNSPVAMGETQERGDTRKRSIDIGTAVFAQWVDNHYYAAKVIKQDSATSDKWHVQFEDDQLRVLDEEFILPIKMFQKKQSITVLTENKQEGRPAVIVGYNKDGDELEYSVEMDDGGTVMVPRSWICMTREQVRLLCESDGNNARSGLSVPRKLRGKRDQLLDSSTQSSSGQSTLSWWEMEQKLKVGQLEHPEAPEQLLVDEGVMGPLPRDKSIFQGLAFILTKTTERAASHVPEPVPYNKDYIRKQLEAGGGMVLDRFDEAYSTTGLELLVVCNRPCRTERYIRSLAASIRAVSNEWVANCCKAGPEGARLALDNYYLDAGYDLDGKPVPWKSTTGRCLSGTRVLLSGTKFFNDLWQPILMEAQCVIVFRFPARATGWSGAQNVHLESPDFVLTNFVHPPRQIKIAAQQIEIPLLSSEYIIQSLIHGEKLQMGDRAQFNYEAGAVDPVFPQGYYRPRP